MFSWSLLIGGAVYCIVGCIFDLITLKYLQSLTDKVMEVYNDYRYADMIWYSISVKDTKLNRLIANVVFTAFWPITCIAAILKAEWNYDKIMRRNAFRRKVP